MFLCQVTLGIGLVLNSKLVMLHKCLRYLTKVNVSQAGACEVDGTLSRAKLYIYIE